MNIPVALFELNVLSLLLFLIRFIWRTRIAIRKHAFIQNIGLDSYSRIRLLKGLVAAALLFYSSQYLYFPNYWRGVAAIAAAPGAVMVCLFLGGSLFGSINKLSSQSRLRPLESYVAFEEQRVAETFRFALPFQLALLFSWSRFLGHPIGWITPSVESTTTRGLYLVTIIAMWVVYKQHRNRNLTHPTNEDDSNKSNQ